jgi:hypothetical protein
VGRPGDEQLLLAEVHRETHLHSRHHAAAASSIHDGSGGATDTISSARSDHHNSPGLAGSRGDAAASSASAAASTAQSRGGDGEIGVAECTPHLPVSSSSLAIPATGLSSRLLAHNTNNRGEGGEDDAEALKNKSRLDNRITRMLMKKRALEDLVKIGVLTEAEMTKSLFEFNTKLQTEDDNVLERKSSLTQELGIPTFDPYTDHNTLDVGRESELQKEVKQIKIRFSPSNVFTIENIELGGDTNIQYMGWGVKYVPAGRSDMTKTMTKKGQRLRPFNFSGTIKTLPDFHNALRTLETSCKITKLLPLSETAKITPDCHGIIDISMIGKRSYTSTTIKFQDYCFFIQDAPLKKESGNVSTYSALTMTKKKSEKSLKNSRAGDKKYYELSIPVSYLSNLIHAIEVGMYINKMKPLPLTAMPNLAPIDSLLTPSPIIQKVQQHNLRLEREREREVEAGKMPQPTSSSTVVSSVPTPASTSASCVTTTSHSVTSATTPPPPTTISMTQTTSIGQLQTVSAAPKSLPSAVTTRSSSEEEEEEEEDDETSDDSSDDSSNSSAMEESSAEETEDEIQNSQLDHMYNKITKLNKKRKKLLKKKDTRNNKKALEALNIKIKKKVALYSDEEKRLTRNSKKRKLSAVELTESSTENEDKRPVDDINSDKNSDNISAKKKKQKR